MQGIAIREARPADAKAIHDVLASAFLDMRGRGYPTRALETAVISPETIQERIRQGGHVLVVETEGQVVGTASGLEEHETLHVCSVAVDPDWQERGIARKLMEALEAYAKQMGCRKLWLHTAWAMTEAIQLYERLGYQREGYLPQHFYGEDFLAFGKVLKRAAESPTPASDPLGAILIFPGGEELDFIGVYEVLTKAKAMQAEGTVEGKSLPEVLLIAHEQRIVCANGLVVLPHERYTDLTAFEFVIVPGGRGVHALREDDALLTHLAALDREGKTICSVCTGALVLAWAGILKGRKATTHHLYKAQLESHCQIVDQRVVCDGNVITAAGVSSSLDLGFFLLEQLHGSKTAEAVTQRLEYRS